MQEDKDPYSNYELDDWQWEFLRRNPCYGRRYRAVQRAKDRKWGYEFEGKFVFLAEVWAIELRRLLSLCNPPRKGDPDSFDDSISLPNPNFPRHEFKYSPVERFPAVALVGQVVKHPDPKLADLNLEGLFESRIPQDCKVTVDIDTRCKWEVILSEVRKQIQPYISKNRSRMENYKSYLDVWDLRRNALTDTRIAEKLWPEDYETIGGRDSHTGDKGSLMQRVHDYERAAKRLIENSFPPKERSPKIKK